MLKSLGQVLRKAATHYPLQSRWDIRSNVRNRWRIFIHDRRHGLDRSGLAKRRFSGQHLVENYANCKDVAAWIGNFTANLLGRHVGNCPQHLSLGGFSLQADGWAIQAYGLSWIQLGQSEIKDLDPPILRHPNVFRF